MNIRNPTGRTVRLEILVGDVPLTLTLGPHTTVDLARYQRALDALAWADQGKGTNPDE